MAFTSGAATSMADLFTKLNTFVTANGWTEDEPAGAPTDRIFWHKGSVFVAFRWDSGTPQNVGIYQALAYAAGPAPGNQANDSGQGVVTGTNATLATGRSVVLANGTMNYYAFLNASPDYVHVVVEVTAGHYQHFGFGNLSKFGTWTGGEYCYGQVHTTLGGTGSRATQNDSTALLDGLLQGVTPRPWAATLHMESLPSQTASTHWALVWGGGTAAGTDRGGLNRMFAQGGFRGGFPARNFGRFSGTALTGLLPMYPINVLYRPPTGTDIYPLGTMPDVRGINMAAFTPAQQVTVGADTWYIFPTEEKNSLTTGSFNQGIAYKKVP